MTKLLQSQRLLQFRRVPSCIGGFLMALLYAGSAIALCASPKEGGTWTNMDSSGDPYLIKIALTDCGDQVLNGVPTKTRYGVAVSVKQSSGALYQRPQVEAQYRTSQGKRWLVAKVPTGGYVDNMWMRTSLVGGKTRLYVYILHKSLDSKPDATSTLWFSK